MCTLNILGDDPLKEKKLQIESFTFAFQRISGDDFLKKLKLISSEKVIELIPLI